MYINGWISFAFPASNLITVKEINPIPIPFEILNVSGMVIKVRKAGNPFSNELKSISRTIDIIKNPTTINAGATA